MKVHASKEGLEILAKKFWPWMDLDHSVPMVIQLIKIINATKD